MFGNLIATPSEFSIVFEISALKTGASKNLIILSRDITSKMIFGIFHH